MAKTFKGFTNQQTHQLLKEMGFTGPAQKDEMDAFLASSPSAASKLGRYNEIAKQRVEGGPMSGMGMNQGGTVDEQMTAFNQASAAMAKGGDEEAAYKPVSRITSPTPSTPTARETTSTDANELKRMLNIQENYPNATEEQRDLLFENEKAGEAYGTATTRIRNELGIPEQGMTPQQAQQLEAALKNTPEFKAMQDTGEAVQSSMSLGVSPTRTTGTRMVDSPVDEQGRPLYRSELAGPPMPGIDPTTPEGSQVLKPGTPTPETTQPSLDLDAAQQSYSDAEGALVEANLAKDQAEEELALLPADFAVDEETGRVPAPTYEQVLEDIGGVFEGSISIGSISPYELEGFKSLVGSGDIPEDPSDYEIETLAKIPEDPTQKFVIKYPNGQTIEFSTSNNAIIADPAAIAYVLERGLNQAKSSDVYSTITSYNKTIDNLEDADALVTSTKADVAVKQKQFETTDIPSTSEALGKAITSPSSVLSQPTVYGLKVENNQLIDEGTGQVATAASLLVKQAQAADAVEDPAVKATLAYLDGLTEEEKAAKYPMPEPPSLTLFQRLLGGTISDAEKAEYDKAVAGVHARIEQDAIAGRAETYDAKTSIDDVRTEVEKVTAAVGVLSEDAKMTAANMTPGDLAQLQGEFKDPAKLDSYNVILTEDDVVRINEERTRMQAGMANALATGNTAAYEDIKAAYEQAGAAVQKAYETGTVVGDLEEDERQYPAAAKFDSYTTSEEVTADEPDEIEAAGFETDTPKATAEVDYDLPPTEVAKVEESAIQDAAKFDEYATAPEKKSEYVPDVTAEETTVGEDEIADINDILNNEEVIVTAKTLEALNEASTAKAATATFSQQLEAKSITGTVSGNATVQGQMEKLMASFNDGTPAWAAGALRKANAAMTARGLGGSSMAMAAIAQATIESALPIAQQDAATFAAMDMENVRNEQAVALANAAAAQNFELANLSNEQAVRIQNSMNNANLQLQNLSNEQEAVLAMAGFKASLQGQELSISANVALSNAARYAAVNDINLTNRQQTTLLKSTQNLEVEMANLSNAQQTALSNLQVQASMMGQELTNEQQMAVLESTQAFETNMQDATNKQQAFIQDAVAKAAMEGRVLDNKQQTALFNISNQVAERGIELNNEQQTRIFNMSNKMTIDVENLSSRQQTALANAQIEATMKGQELSNKQQSNVIKAERIAEVANMNFTAEQSRALQNAQLTQTVDLANLSNAQAKLLADCAALSDVDMANLSNNQQAAAQQAQAFLEMDMANLDNEQQAVMFEAQSLVQSIFSDQAAENAQLQFNAESINQVNQFYDSMTTQVQQFNTAQANAVEQFNAGEENSMTKFQAELDNQRDMFNASNELVIAQANTVWRQSVATANTAALNEANMAEVMAANNLTMQGLNELWQQERDLMSMAWETADNAMNRDAQIAIANINKSGDAGDSNTWGDMLSSTAGEILVKGISNILNL